MRFVSNSRLWYKKYSVIAFSIIASLSALETADSSIFDFLGPNTVHLIKIALCILGAIGANVHQESLAPAPAVAEDPAHPTPAA